MSLYRKEEEKRGGERAETEIFKTKNSDGERTGLPTRLCQTDGSVNNMFFLSNAPRSSFSAICCQL